MVGFKNPPEESKFKKGQSGNPKGRPKKRPHPVSDTLYRFYYDRIITMRDQDRKPMKVSRCEYIHMKAISDAMQRGAPAKEIAILNKSLRDSVEWAAEYERQRPLSIPTVLRMIGPDARL